MRSLILVALFLGAAGCATPSKRLDYLAQRNLRETTAESGTGGLTQATARNVAARVEEVIRLNERGLVVSAKDHYNAALVLVDSSRLPDLELAEKLGLRAAELGEERGFRVAARAVDRGLMMQGRQQKYGTMFVYEVVLKQWKLYSVDPRTTDAEREAMGVEPYLRLLEIERKLNQETDLRLADD